MIFNLGICGRILLAELNTYTGGAVTLRAFGCHPHDLAGNRDLLRLVHQGQEHEYFVANIVGLVGSLLGPIFFA